MSPSLVNYQRIAAQFNKPMICKCSHHGIQIDSRSFLKLRVGNISCRHQQEAPGTVIYQKRLDEVIILGDNDSTLVICDGTDLRIRCSISMLQIERMPGVVTD